MKKEDILECVGIPTKVRKALLAYNPTMERTSFDQSLFLWGPAGHGKTVLAASILAEVLYRKIHIPTVLEMINPQSDLYVGTEMPLFARQYRFVKVPELLTTLKKSFSPVIGAPTVDWVKLCSQAKLLVLDDIGSELNTDWAYLTLYEIADARYNEELPTIFTSNLSPQELGRRFADERLVSRIFEMCGPEGIRFIEGEDYRISHFSKSE